MYVCVCRAVTDDDVRRHAAEGVCTTKEIRATCGMRPGCGQCVPRICALLDECATSGARALLTEQVAAGVSGAVAV